MGHTDGKMGRRREGLDRTDDANTAPKGGCHSEQRNGETKKQRNGDSGLHHCFKIFDGDLSVTWILHGIFFKLEMGETI